MTRRRGDSDRRARGEAQGLEGLPRAVRRRMRTSFSALRDFLLRGGRLTKVARTVASYAPSLGKAGSPVLATASALAIAAGMSTLWGATAGEALAAGAAAKGEIAVGAGDAQGAAQAAGAGEEGAAQAAGEGEQGASGQTDGTSITGSHTEEFTVTVNMNGATNVTMDASATITSTGTGINFGSRGALATPLTFVQQPNGGTITGGSGPAISLNSISAAPDVSFIVTGSLNTTGTGADGVSVIQAPFTATSDNSLTVQVGDINAGRHGIHLNNVGQKTVSITVTGRVQSTGKTVRESKQGHGIRLTMANRSSGARADIFVSGNVTGGGGGREVEAGDGFAIYFAAKHNVPVGIVIQSGGVVGARGGRAIFDAETNASEANFGGDTTITVQSGGTLLGDVRLFEGIDKVHVLGGGSFEGRLDAGGESARTVSRDTIVLESGAQGTLSSLAGVGSVTVRRGASLKVTGGLDKVYNLVAAGNLDLADGAVQSLRLGKDPTSGNPPQRNARVAGTFTGGGTVKLDLDLDTNSADNFTIKGNIVGNTVVELVTKGAGSLGADDLVLIFASDEDIVPPSRQPGVTPIPVTALSRGMFRISERDKNIYDNYIVRLRPDQRKFYVKIPGKCYLDTGNGVHTCVDEIIATQSLSASGDDILDVRLAPNAWAATRSGNAFTLTGDGDDGISFVQSATGDDVKISGHYDYITGKDTAIAVTNTGAGAVTITTLGTVTGEGATAGSSHAGIRVTNAASGASVTINAATVTGANFGIEVESTSTNAVAIAVSGSVAGGSGANDAAIRTTTSNVAKTRIALESGAVAGASGRAAIKHTGGDVSVTVGTGAVIAGSVAFGDRDDTLIFAGGAARGAALEGGGGTDSVLFQSGGGRVDSGSVTGLTNFETLSIESGAAASITIDGTVSLTNMTLAGTLNFQDAMFTTLELTGSSGVMLAGGGTFAIDVDFGQNKADKLILAGNGNVTGSVTGETTVNVNVIGESAQEVVIAEISATSSQLSLGNWATFAQASNLTGGYTIAARESGKKLVVSQNGCFESSQGSGAFTCRGTLINQTQTLSASGNTTLAVTLPKDTRVATAGTAFNLSQTGGGGIDFNQSATGQTISATGVGEAIKATNSGAGKIEILTTGTVTAVSGHAIHAKTEAMVGRGHHDHGRRRHLRGQREFPRRLRRQQRIRDGHFGQPVGERARRPRRHPHPVRRTSRRNL